MQPFTAVQPTASDFGRRRVFRYLFLKGMQQPVSTHLSIMRNPMSPAPFRSNSPPAHTCAFISAPAISQGRSSQRHTDWYHQRLQALVAGVTVGQLLKAGALAIVHFFPYQATAGDDRTPEGQQQRAAFRRLMGEGAFIGGCPSMHPVFGMLEARLRARGSSASSGGAGSSSGSGSAGSAGAGSSSSGGAAVVPLEMCIFLASTPQWRHVGLVQLAKAVGAYATNSSNQNSCVTENNITTSTGVKPDSQPSAFSRAAAACKAAYQRSVAAATAAARVAALAAVAAPAAPVAVA